MDTKAVKYVSDNAAEQGIRRLCKENAKGKRKVNDAIANQFFEGGAARKELIRLYVEAGGNHDP